MARFCGNCGSPIGDSSQFCGSCGKPTNSQVSSTNAAAPPQSVPVSPVSTGFTPVTQSPAPFTPVANAGPQPSPASPAVASSAPPAKSGALAKIVVVIVGLVCVGGLLAVAGTVYLAHKVHQKVKAVEHQVLGGGSSSDSSQQNSSGGLSALLSKATSSSDSSDSSSSIGDPCRFLSKEDVSRAAGIEITHTEAKDSGCMYYAHGDPAEMTSKHMTAMVSNQAASNGSNVTPQQQKMMQQITGAFFKQQEASDKSLSAEAATGEVIVLALSFDTQNAQLKMKLNRGAFNHVTGSSPSDAGDGSTDKRGTGDLSGIGDEAYQAGGSALFVRKGNVFVQLMFQECPCSVNAIKLLAQKLVSQL